MKTGASVLIFVFAYLCTSGQEVDIQPFLDAWKVTNRSQSHRAQVFYDQLDRTKDTALFHLTIEKLRNYLSKHPDKRLRARTDMYEGFGAMVFQYTDNRYILLMEEAMQIAHELGDDQLMAEIYVFYAEMKAFTNHLLYNLKAIELQRRIGFSNFSTVHNRFFIVSNALYHTREYRQSIKYGLECLSFEGIDTAHWSRKVYILQLDILGAAYKRLSRYDSSIYYYKKILDTLSSRPDAQSYQDLWVAIAKGNIGHCLGLQKNFSAAIPLLQEYVNTSTRLKEWFNVALAQNDLADVYQLQQDYPLALNARRNAYYWATRTNSFESLLESARGMADIFRATGKTDSAFQYYDLFHVYRDSVIAHRDRAQLSAMNAQIAFDNLQESLSESELALIRSKYTLRWILAGIGLLSIIAWLLYNRYRLKEKYKMQSVQRQREAAELEVRNAKDQIEGFKSNIVEKNNLIEAMQAQLASAEQSSAEKPSFDNLSQYTLVSEDEWEKFRAEFAKAYPAFLSSLKQKLSQITPAEERLSILIYLQLNNYQIANTLGIGKESVSRSKRRLKQRLNLPEITTVDEYLTNTLVTKH